MLWLKYFNVSWLYVKLIAVPISFKLISWAHQHKNQTKTKQRQMTTSNTFQARVQLQYFHRRPVEIIHGDTFRAEPL